MYNVRDIYIYVYMSLWAQNYGHGVQNKMIPHEKVIRLNQERGKDPIKDKKWTKIPTYRKVPMVYTY